MRFRLALLAAVTLLQHPLRAQTPTAPAPGDTPPLNVALTVSGGVSLGNYQAGATYAFIHVLRHQQQLADAMKNSPLRSQVGDHQLRPRRLDVLTGASAGNVNALLAALDYCSRDGVRNPEQSLYWKLWVLMGYQELTGPRRKDDTGIFTQRAFDPIFDDLKAFADSAPARARCDLVLGLTTTKLTPVTDSILQGVAYPVQRHAGVFRLVAYSDGRMKFVQPRQQDVFGLSRTSTIVLDPIDSGSTDRHPLAPRAGSPLVLLPWYSVRSLAEASGAFPIAFTPREVRYYPLDRLQLPGDSLAPCEYVAESRVCAPPVRGQHFVDGGVFDNRPMGLALALGDAAGGAMWRTRAREALDTIIAAQAESLRRQSACGPQAAPTLAITAQDSARVGAAAATGDTVAMNQAWRELMLEKARQYGDDRNQRGVECTSAIRRMADLLGTRASFDLAPQRLLYYIDEEPMRIAIGRYRALEKEKYAGLFRMVGFAGSVFETGSNVELRSFQEALGRRPDVSFDVNTRYAPLMAEHVQHFGAFFHPAFRQLDFYTGLYDGLRSAFRSLYCTPDSLRASAGARRAIPPACEVAWTRLALADNATLELSPAGRAVVDRLLDVETRPSQAGDPTELDARASVLTELLKANLAVRASPEAFACATSGIMETPLCEYGMLAIVREWKRRLSPDTLDWRTSMRAAGFNNDVDMAFVDDPVVAYNTALTLVLQRLRATEIRAQNEGSASIPGGVGVTLYVQRAYTERFRSCFNPRVTKSCADINPTSADVNTNGWASRVLPHSASILLAGHTQWTTWRPTLYLVRKERGTLGIVAPFELVHRNGAGWFGQQGAGLHVALPGTVLSGLTSSLAGFGSRGTTLDVTASLAANVFRLGYRRQLTDSGAEGVTFGIGDVNGLSARLISTAFRAAWARVGGG